MRMLPALLVSVPLAAAVQSAPLHPTTFNGEIASLIYHNCSECHRPGEAAPFPLLSYADVVKKGKMIAKVTASRVMPPWKAEPASFAYRDERRLNESDVALIQKWVKEGMPEGNG